MEACRWSQGIAVARTLIGEQTQSNLRALPSGGQAIGPYLVVCHIICYYYIEVNSSSVMCIIYQ